MIKLERFEEYYRDAWILTSYLKALLNRCDQKRKPLQTLQTFHNELLNAAKDILNATEEEGHRQQVQQDYSLCIKDCQGLLVLLIAEVEKFNRANTMAPNNVAIRRGMKKTRDRIYKAVGKVDKIISIKGE